MNIDNNTIAAIFSDIKSYPENNPFDPPMAFPEYRGSGIDAGNRIYGLVREILHKLNLDSEHYNTPDWNPFKDIIKPGMTVFIKPNTVYHENLVKKDIFAVITHASILRPILDYVCIALNNQGRIIIGDSQIIIGNFEKAAALSQIDELVDWYRGQSTIPVEYIDLRTVRSVRSYLYGRWTRKNVYQDTRGYQWVDLGDKSFFKDHDPKRLRIAIANYKKMIEHHSGGKHEYLFPKSFLESDVVISIPKLKTHRRTAITIAIKNFMGIPASKDSLPHFYVGASTEGGDQYINPSTRKKIGTHLHDIIQSNPFIPVKFATAVIKKLLWNSSKIIPFKDDVFEAMWPGNDTVWRTLFDLNRIIFYADKNGTLRDTQQRAYFCLVDGIVGGAKDGPIANEPVYSGVLIGGHNPVLVDAVGTTIMGFDIKKIPLVQNALDDHTSVFPAFERGGDSIRIVDGDTIKTLQELADTRNLHFEPHPNWKGFIELDPNGDRT